MKRFSLIAGISLAGMALAGCASAPEPKEHVVAAEAVIRSAEEIGAKKVPEAALHLQLAREQAEHGQQLIKAGQNERAGFVLMRAEADGELALALARESSSRAEAQEALDKVRALKAQAAPGGG